MLQLDTSVFWEKNDRPQNAAAAVNAFRPPVLQQDLGTFTSGITKMAAEGTTLAIRNNTTYEGNNILVRCRQLAPGFQQRLEHELRSVVHPSVVARQRCSIQPHRRSFDL